MPKPAPPKPSPPKPPHLKPATAYHQLGQVLRDLETDLCWRLKDSPRIPEAWHDIAAERTQPAKQKVTLRLDEDVVRFFRSMGQGHLTRMNAVLRTFMLARLAEVVKAEAEYKPPPAEEEEYRQQMALYSRMLLARMREG